MGEAGRTFENRNPANTDELVGYFVKGTAQDIHDAAEAAAAALPGWAGMSGPAAAIFFSKPPISWTASSTRSPPI